MTVISKVLLGGALDPAVLEDAKRSTFVVVDDPLRQYSMFFLRLVAATVVATAGIAADSATTIIGAMLIAPLMSPMLGVALASALGRPRDVFRTLGLTLFGMAIVVTVSAGVTALIPAAADMETNSQVLARVSPRLVDLVIALAAGFVAALASMRHDIPDTLPGVAISASIVPPLCVVGAGLCEGALRASVGALLLFVANFIAIQVMGAVVYMLMGIIPRRESVPASDARAAWYAITAMAALALVLALMDASMGIVRSNELERQVQSTTAAWVRDSGYRVTSVSVDGREVYVQIAGSGSEPSARSLASSLAEKDVDVSGVSVSVVEEHRVTTGA